jgi:hypothetical protein
MIAAGLLAAAPTHAEEPGPIEASMQCDRALEPGRVRCSVEARAAQGKSIAWADVVIVSLPDFATPLKGRLGREDATAREPGDVKWAFGVVAKKAGQGEAKARVRLSVCDGAAGARCIPVVVDVHAALSVGG